MYTVQTQSYVKLMLHAAKRPASSVCGLLLGQRQGKRVLVSDAAPLFHHEAPLAPMLEVACAMVDAYCRKRCSTIEIVGFYYATSGDSVSASTSGLSYFAEKVADKLEQICSQACVVLVQLGVKSVFCAGRRFLRQNACMFVLLVFIGKQ